MSEETKRPRQLNFNTIVSAIVLAAVVWVGKSIQEGNDKLAHLSERLSVIEAMNVAKVDQLNRIEAQMSHQQAQINEMALEFARMKSKP